MNRVNKILKHPKYKEYLSKIDIYEKNREFCKHNISHFLDMGRICYIICLERELKVNKEIIYAVALLHDIGRWAQYEYSIPHEKASFDLSREILIDCDFSIEEIEEILQGILSHRDKEAVELNEIFYLGDKLSRGCFSCKAEPKCNWSKDKKNLNIIY